MNKLTHEDKHHLNAAEGWLGLGVYASAIEELEQITPELRMNPKVVAVRWEIYWESKNWKACVELGGSVVKTLPNSSNAWIGRSFALHELKRTQEAYDLLLPAKAKFPKNATIPYNLACYCAQLGRLDEAENWLKKAMAINQPEVKRMAVVDPDLKPLRDKLGNGDWTLPGEKSDLPKSPG